LVVAAAVDVAVKIEKYRRINDVFN